MARHIDNLHENSRVAGLAAPHQHPVRSESQPGRRNDPDHARQCPETGESLTISVRPWKKVLHSYPGRLSAYAPPPESLLVASLQKEKGNRRYPRGPSRDQPLKIRVEGMFEKKCVRV